MDHRNVTRRGLEAARKKVPPLDGSDGRKPITFHGLRHTFASVLIAQGEDIDHISRQLGHKSPTTTLAIYSHEFASAKKAARTAERLEGSFGALVRSAMAHHGHHEDKIRAQGPAISGGTPIVAMRGTRDPRS